MNWWLCTELLTSARGERCRIASPDGELTFAATIELWQHDPAFADFYGETLAAFDCEAFRWEHPPVTRSTLDRPYEFVVFDDPLLGGRTPEPEPFAPQFARQSPEQTVITFPNLGGDAILVVPCPAPGLAYPDLASFLRSAPRSQKREFWQQIGTSVTARVSDRALWLSTAGGGVAWLHVRLDLTPKYYHHQPYRGGR